MAIIKSKTISATGYSKGAMEFYHVLNNDGVWVVRYSQSYQFTDGIGLPVPGLQNKYAITGEISDADLQRLLPDVWNALAFLYGWFDGEIRRQEGIQ